MRRFWSDLNPTVRGFAVIVVIVIAVLVLNQQKTVVSLLLIARIGFFIAIAVFVYLMWRERRMEISTWPSRARLAFYGGALLIVAAIGTFILQGASGRNALAFFAILGLSGFAMFRAWRDQHSYG